MGTIPIALILSRICFCRLCCAAIQPLVRATPCSGAPWPCAPTPCIDCPLLQDSQAGPLVPDAERAAVSGLLFNPNRKQGDEISNSNIKIRSQLAKAVSFTPK